MADDLVKYDPQFQALKTGFETAKLAADRRAQTAQNAASDVADYDVVDPATGTAAASGIPGARRSALDAEAILVGGTHSTLGEIDPDDSVQGLFAGDAGQDTTYGFAPLDALSISSDTTWLFTDALAAGSLKRLSVWCEEAGTLKIKRYSESGGAYAFVEERSVVIAAGSVGQRVDLGSSDFGTLTFDAGDVLALWSDTRVYSYQTGQAETSSMLNVSGDNTTTISGTPATTFTIRVEWVITEGATGSLPSRLTDLEAASVDHATRIGALEQGGDGEASGIAVGRERLAEWRRALGLAEAGAGHATLACVMDSWGMLPQIVPAIRSVLATYGYATHPGWAGIPQSGSQTWDGITVTASGTWSREDQQAGGVHSLDGLAYTTSTGSSALTVQATCERAVVHYRAAPGGGAVEVSLSGSGGGVLTQSTDAASGLGTVEIAGAGEEARTLTITRQSGTVTILGVQLLGQSGVSVMQSGNSGATAASTAGVDGAAWTAGLGATGASLVLVGLTTNDAFAGASPADFEADLRTIVGRIKAALPEASILMLAPADAGRSQAHPTSDYAARIRAVAEDTGAAWYDMDAEWEDYATEDARGMWLDTAHPSHAGAYRLARALCRELLA